MNKKGPKNLKEKSPWILGGIVVLFFLIYSFVPFLTRDEYKVGEAQNKKDTEKLATPPTPEKVAPVVEHLATPVPMKGLYMSACAASTPSFRASITKIVETTELNSIIIDIKDYSGKLSFNPTNETLKPYVSTGCEVKDMADFIKELHSKNIYVIGRVTTFQDPFYSKLHPETGIVRKDTGALWTDKSGLSYIDPGSKVAWDHLVAIAEASYGIGFDEINFDYIRYPSDGAISNAAFPLTAGRPKAQVLETFFQHLYGTLHAEGIPISADFFGMTTTAQDDMGIGQVLEAALPYFDYLYPMVYPSHYPPTFNGWQNPNAVPYDLIKFVMGAAIHRAEATSTIVKTLTSEKIASSSPVRYTHEPVSKDKLRPWIQDFSLGKPVYTATEVRAQIQASEDIGLSSWILWNAANHYTVSALKPE
jgi:hypothetical protein